MQQLLNALLLAGMAGVREAANTQLLDDGEQQQQLSFAAAAAAGSSRSFASVRGSVGVLAGAAAAAAQLRLHTCIPLLAAIAWCNVVAQGRYFRTACVLVAPGASAVMLPVCKSVLHC